MTKRTYILDDSTVKDIDVIADKLAGKSKSDVVNRAVQQYLAFVKKGRVNDPFFKNDTISISDMDKK